MFELVVECLVFLLIYKIFERGFLHDSKCADIRGRSSMRGVRNKSHNAIGWYKGYIIDHNNHPFFIRKCGGHLFCLCCLFDLIVTRPLPFGLF